MRRNTYRMGDTVTCVYDNGVGEGVLWTVVRVKDNDVMLEPRLTLTGSTVLNRKTVNFNRVKYVDIVKLGLVYMQLGQVLKRLTSPEENPSPDDRVPSPG